MHHFVVLPKHLIVLVDSGHVDDSVHVVEHVNPLAALRPLTADIEDTVRCWRLIKHKSSAPELDALDREAHLNSATSRHSNMQDVLIGWHVVAITDTL